MKKKILILSLAIFVISLIATSSNACGTNQILINMWNSRKDLQEKFPGDPECNPELEQWARDTGWLKHKELIDYSPLKEEFHGLSQRIIQLENRIKELERKPVGNQIYQPIIKSTPENGEWIKCYGTSSGKFNCDIEKSGGRYEVYFLTKKQ